MGEARPGAPSPACACGTPPPPAGRRGRAQEIQGDLYDKAVELLAGLIKTHPFESGNRRTAFLVTSVLLKLNVPGLRHERVIFDWEKIEAIIKLLRGEESSTWSQEESRGEIWSVHIEAPGSLNDVVNELWENVETLGETLERIGTTVVETNFHWPDGIPDAACYLIVTFTPPRLGSKIEIRYSNTLCIDRELIDKEKILKGFFKAVEFAIRMTAKP